jgi:hypothetical protein
MINHYNWLVNSLSVTVIVCFGYLSLMEIFYKIIKMIFTNLFFLSES